MIDLGDLNANEKVGAILDEIVGRGEEICLVHNAAAMVFDSTQGTDPEKLSQVLRTNVVAPVIFNRHLIEKMNSGSETAASCRGGDTECGIGQGTKGDRSRGGRIF